MYNMGYIDITAKYDKLGRCSEQNLRNICTKTIKPIRFRRHLGRAREPSSSSSSSSSSALGETSSSYDEFRDDLVSSLR